MPLSLVPEGNKFDTNFSGSHVPEELIAAVEALAALARSGYRNEWTERDDSHCLEEQIRAIELGEAALRELRTICAYSAHMSLEPLREEIAQKENLLGRLRRAA